MGDLLIGWPLEHNKNSTRHYQRLKKSASYGDISRAERYKDDGHLITFAPTGAGKGVSVIIPNLLHYDGPIIVIDPKGENFAVTARYRRDVLGQDIFLLDPFECVGETTLAKLKIGRSSLNPLDLVSSFGKNIETQLTMIASIFAGDLTSSGSGEYGKFWDNEAQKLLAGALGLAIERAQEKGERPSFQLFIDNIYSDDVALRLAEELDKKGLSGFTHKAIAAFLVKAEKERSGVLSTAQSYLNPFISDAVNSYLSTSSIKPERIAGADDYTIYIVIPPSKLVSHSILLRLWVAASLNIIMERDETPLKRTLFILDECAQLGALDELRKAITLLRGYGLQVWMFFQDYSQLTRLYTQDHSTMINNCGVFQAFGISRTSGAIPISRTIGRFGPKQLTQLGKTQQVASFANSTSPQIFRLHNYLKDEAFRDRFDPNPLFFRTNRASSPNVEPFPTNHLKIHT